MDLLIFQAHIMSKETKTTTFGFPPTLGWSETEKKVINPRYIPLFVGAALTVAAARVGYLAYCIALHKLQNYLPKETNTQTTENSNFNSDSALE